jgi:S-DNA-T family DNA segregation ATPase FtsK/SpoIIIE
MTSLNIQQVASAKYRTSAAADKLTKDLMELLGLSTKASVARLAIGRSLGAGALPEDPVDSKGVEIQSNTIFRQDDLGFWISLMLAHDQQHSPISNRDADSLRNLIRRHWHRGVHLLTQDWLDSDNNYDKFVTNLVSRRAELDPSAGKRDDGTALITEPVQAEDLSVRLGKALSEIGVSGEVKEPIHGPRVSRYKVVLRDVNKLSVLRGRLESLGLSLNLGGNLPLVTAGDEAKSVFIDLARPRDSWKQSGRKEFEAAVATLPKTEKLIVCPGVDVMGNPFTLDISGAPHVLIGGATGQGKSVCMHTFILSLLMQHGPDKLQLSLVDPKQVEFSVYEKVPHLWGGRVAVGAAAALDTVQLLVEEMDRRYSDLRSAGVSNIVDGRAAGLQMPYIVVCVDELADLLLQDDTVEESLVRLAQMGRGAGIHLIVATQRPDAKTISGLIRSNIPCRVALRVQKSSESKIILDDTGAEDLLGAGDMLVKTSGVDGARVHGYFLSLSDVKSILSSLRTS